MQYYPSLRKNGKIFITSVKGEKTQVMMKCYQIPILKFPENRLTLRPIEPTREEEEILEEYKEYVCIFFGTDPEVFIGDEQNNPIVRHFKGFWKELCNLISIKDKLFRKYCVVILIRWCLDNSLTSCSSIEKKEEIGKYLMKIFFCLIRFSSLKNHVRMYVSTMLASPRYTELSRKYIG